MVGLTSRHGRLVPVVQRKAKTPFLTGVRNPSARALRAP
jgi:hypothetical protein